jgi:serine/threonine-protein kinase
MVMEHLVGTDLHQMLADRRTLPVADVVDYLLQGMEAIAEAHAAGIVHRDLKPANLFVASHPDGSPLVKVLDFGISKAGSSISQDQSLTATQTIMGSPLYMSPEQLRSSKNVDARTDVWALGVMLYEALVGRPPFEAETVTGLCAKIAADAPVPLREHDPSLPAELDAVVMRCLEKSVDRRFASVAELAVALRPFASAGGLMAIDRIARIGGVPGAVPSGPIVVAPSSGARASTGGQTETAWQTTSTAGRRRTTLLATGGVVVLLALGAALVVVRMSKHPASIAQPAALVASSPSASPSAPVALAPTDTASAAGSTTTTTAPSTSTTSPTAPSAKPSVAARPPPRTAPVAPSKPDDLLLDRK